jgi:hypothetical protein
LIDALGLAVAALSGLFLLLLGRFRRARPARLRAIPGLARLYRAFGLSVEDGSRLLVGLGGQSLLTQNAGAALAGLSLLRELSQKASVSDRPPVAVAGESALAFLAQDTLHAGYRAVGAGEFYQPVMGRLAGMTAFSSAAATIPMLGDENVSLAALIGNFGVEAGLLSEAAERSHVLVIGATSDPAGQSVLYATAPEALIGEELFAAPVYLAGAPGMDANLILQDILRWLIILGLLLGSALKIVGLI